MATGKSHMFITENKEECVDIEDKQNQQSLQFVLNISFLTSKPLASRDRLVVRTLRCGRSNPGSNPGHGMQKNVFFVSRLGWAWGTMIDPSEKRFLANSTDI